MFSDGVTLLTTPLGFDSHHRSSSLKWSRLLVSLWSELALTGTAVNGKSIFSCTKHLEVATIEVAKKT